MQIIYYIILIMSRYKAILPSHICEVMLFPESKTTESRVVENSSTAKYKTNKLKVLSIYNIETNLYEGDNFIGKSYFDHSFTYKKGEIKEMSDWTENSNGIYYFITYESAVNWGSIYIFPEINNSTDSEYNVYFSNGQQKVRGSKLNDKRHGTWKWYWRNGNIRTICNYVDGEKKGVYINFCNNSNKRSYGVMDHNKKNGNWKFYYNNSENSLKRECHYLNDILYGSVTKFFKNHTKKLQGEFSGGKKHGNFIFYRQNSNNDIRKSGKFNNGLKHGKWQYCRHNGNIFEGECIENLKCKQWKLYNNKEDRILRKDITYKSGYRSKLLSYHNNGNIREIGNLENNKRNGYWQVFDEEGELKMELVYNKGDISYVSKNIDKVSKKMKIKHINL